MPRVPRLRAPGAHYGKLCASACRSVHRLFVYLLRLILKNSLRHKLRTILTVVGIVVAITAFGLLHTIVDAWYAGANASSSARLVTRNSISPTFSRTPASGSSSKRRVISLRIDEIGRAHV